MSFDQTWEHQFCLSCDRQTDGATYCSESCRLSDFESSAPSTAASSPASSPSLTPPSYGWPASRPSSKFYLSPAYDFHNAQPYGSSPQAQKPLTPSSSHSSLCSLQSTSSTSSDAQRVSDKAKRQLRDYASSFEHARLQRRRSSN
jgi:hypothetical protein